MIHGTFGGGLRIQQHCARQGALELNEISVAVCPVLFARSTQHVFNGFAIVFYNIYLPTIREPY
jgi:hypothetical protein